MIQSFNSRYPDSVVPSFGWALGSQLILLQTLGIAPQSPTSWLSRILGWRGSNRPKRGKHCSQVLPFYSFSSPLLKTSTFLKLDPKFYSLIEPLTHSWEWVGKTPRSKSKSIIWLICSIRISQLTVTQTPLETHSLAFLACLCLLPPPPPFPLQGNKSPLC